MHPVWLAPLLAAVASLATLLGVAAALEASRQRLAKEQRALVVVASSARRLADEARAAHGHP